MRKPWVYQVLSKGRMLLGGSRDNLDKIRTRKPKARRGSSGDPAEPVDAGSIVADGSDVSIGGGSSDDHGGVIDIEASLLNQALPNYEILGILDRGGQGIVYRALQRSTGRVVALKVLHTDPGASRRREARFAREVELVSRLQHPHVVTIFDSGVAAGRPYLSMELIDGHSIDDYVLLNSPTVRDCVVLFEKICRAVASVHQRGVIHRDLKPSNIRVDLEGEPHILDFGLAKCADDDEGQHSLSLAGQVVGTLPFLSPEQITGNDGGVDIRTDIYALGVILHLLLTGEMPYPIDGPRPEVANNIVTRVPARLDRRGSGEGDAGAIGPISIDLSHIVLKALAKEKDRRYQSADALADDLRRYLDGDAIAARGDGFAYFARVALRKYRVHSMVAGAFVLLLAGSAVGMGYLWQRSERMARDGTYSRSLASGVRSASVKRDKGLINEAIEFDEQAIMFGRQIGQPTVDDNRAMYAAYHDLAQIYLGRPEKSALCKEYCDEACRMADTLIAQVPDESEYKRLLAFASRLRGRIAYDSRSWESARINFEYSIQLFRSLPRSGSDLENAPVDFETVCSRKYLGKTLLKQKAYGVALQLLEDVHKELVRLCKIDDRSMDYQLELVSAKALIANALMAQKSYSGYQKALAQLGSAQSILRSALDSGLAESRIIDARKLEKTIIENMDYATKTINETHESLISDQTGSSPVSGISAGPSSSSPIGSGSSDR